MRSEGASPPAPLVVEVDRVTKIYRRPGSGWQRLGRLLAHRPAPEGFVALSDVSFALPRGEGFGVVGENGAGKSTLLKILAGVTSPTSGRTAVRGRLTSLLELGAGFHPDFSGRQNIQLTAALLGLSAAEVRDCTPQVLDFAELGADIDRPVRTYSSGMAMRLGFAIATSVAPDVLIVDEALSVGDGYFQKKCMDRLLAFVEGGGTLLFCSHAMYYISAFCRRVLWLHEADGFGPRRDRGGSEGVRTLSRPQRRGQLPAKRRRRLAERRRGGGPAGRSPADRGAADTGHRRVAELPVGRAVRFEISWETDDPALAFHLGVGINRSDGSRSFTFSTAWSGLEPFTGRRSHTVRLPARRAAARQGDFILYIFLMDERLLHVFDRRIVRSAFSVTAERYEAGLFHAPHRWLVEEE